MITKEFSEFSNIIRKDLERAYAENNIQLADKYDKILNNFINNESVDDIPMDEAQAINIARLYGTESIYEVLDEKMGFKEGESANQQLWAVSSSGIIKELSNEKLVLSPWRMSYPTEWFRDTCEKAVENELTVYSDGTHYLSSTFSDFQKGEFVLMEIYIAFRELTNGDIHYYAVIANNQCYKDSNGKIQARMDRLGCPWGFRSVKKESIFLWKNNEK